MGLKYTVSSVIRNKRFKSEALPSLEDRLFFEGSRRQAYLVRFVAFLFLSTIIAALGVINDSTATVIGSMIIAPLMTPIMAMAAALMMGDRRRAWQSLLIVFVGVALVIFVSWLMGVIYIGAISYAHNDQIVSRVSPRLTDLIIGLAAGAAGALAISRDDVSDSLPGVAIAISLVPPLCVVGISLSDSQWADASGAMRLFLTNFLAILFAGGGILALLGLGDVATQHLDRRARRRAFLGVAIGIGLISVPLAVTGYAVVKDSIEEYWTLTATEEWLEQTEYKVQNIEADGVEVTIWIVGYGPLPPTSELVEGLQEVVHGLIYINLEIMPSQEVELELDPAEE